MKLEPALADIPVVMLTIVDDKQTGYALGAAEYLLKPIERSRLSSVLARYRNGLEPHALVVEDEPGTRTLLSQTLTKDGWRVTPAENGRVALAVLSEQRPTIILLDLVMPVLDGFEFLLEFRRHEEWRGIPIVVITSLDLSAEELKLLNGGVEGIVQKGASPLAELCRDIRQLVGSYRKEKR